MSLGTIAFNTVYASMPESHCEVILSDKTEISTAISTGFGKGRDYDDRGIGGTISASVRYLASSETGTQAQIGDVVNVKFYGEDDYISLRVSARNATADIVRIDLEGVNER